MCIERTLCRNSCKGQGTFVVHKVDDVIVNYLRALLDQIDVLSIDEKVRVKYTAAQDVYKAKIAEYSFREEHLASQLKTLYAEVADSIMGTSSYAPETLSDIINEVREKLESVREKLKQLNNEKIDRKEFLSSMKFRINEYRRMLNRFFDADISIGEKRMIVSRLLDRVVIQKGTREQYDIKIFVREPYSDFVGR